MIFFYYHVKLFTLKLTNIHQIILLVIPYTIVCTRRIYLLVSNVLIYKLNSPSKKKIIPENELYTFSINVNLNNFEFVLINIEF